MRKYRCRQCENTVAVTVAQLEDIGMPPCWKCSASDWSDDGLATVPVQFGE